MAKPDPSQMPTVPKALGTEKILRLMVLNRRRVHEYYKAQKGAGPTRGENTIGEMIFGALATCDELALEGKEWNPL